MKQFPSQNTVRPVLYITLLVAALACMWMLRKCSTPSPYSAAESRHSGGDTIDVAIEYSPLSIYRYGDTLGGFNYDMLRLISRNENIPLKFHPLTALPEALDGLDRGLYDVVVADIAASADYQKRYSLTRPVYIDRQVLVQMRDSVLMVKSPLQLAGKEVWVSANASVVSRLHNLAAEIGDSIIVHQDSVYGSEQLVMLVAAGEISLAVVNESLARSMAADYPLLDFGTEVSFSQFQPWLLRKSDTILTARLDSAIVRFRNTDEGRGLLKRYLLK